MEAINLIKSFIRKRGIVIPCEVDEVLSRSLVIYCQNSPPPGGERLAAWRAVRAAARDHFRSPKFSPLPNLPNREVPESEDYPPEFLAWVDSLPLDLRGIVESLDGGESPDEYSSRVGVTTRTYWNRRARLRKLAWQYASARNFRTAIAEV